MKIGAAINTRVESSPETPFFRAKQEWDSRIGQTVVQAKNWRIACIFSAGVSIVLSIALCFQISQTKVIPILVGIDKELGEPTVLGPAPDKQYKIGSLEVKYFVSQFIRFVRSVPTDQVVIKQNWIRAYTFLRPAASRVLNDLTTSGTDTMAAKVGKSIVTVQPLSIVQIAGTDSYQVRWREVVYSTSGSKEDEYTMLGTFVLEFEPPKDEQTLQENPLGIFITNFQWNREL